MVKFGRAYANADEKARQLDVFRANAEHVDAVNRAGNRTYKLGLNQFSDLTDDEFVEAYLGYQHQNGHHPEEDTAVPSSSAMSKDAALYNDQDLPDSVDWRAQGAVTEVKDERRRYCSNKSAILYA